MNNISRFLFVSFSFLSFACSNRKDISANSTLQSIKTEDSINVLACRRYTPLFQQFCKVNDTPLTVDLTMPNSSAMDMQKAAELNLGVKLQGLIPLLSFDLNYSDDAACWNNSNLRYNKIELQALESETNTYIKLATILSGNTNYNLTLLWQDGKKFWGTNKSGDNETVTTNFRIIDTGATGETTYRIPKACEIKLSKVMLGFEPTAITSDLSIIKPLVNANISQKTLLQNLLTTATSTTNTAVIVSSINAAITNLTDSKKVIET